MQSAPSVSAKVEGNTIHIRLELAQAGPPDSLVEYPFKLELKAARALVKSGRLPCVRLGRRRYCRNSDLLALVTAEAPAKQSADGYAGVIATLGGAK